MKVMYCIALSLAVHGITLGALSGTSSPAGDEATAIRVKIVTTAKPQAVPPQAPVVKPVSPKPKVAAVAKPVPTPVAKVEEASKPSPVTEEQTTASEQEEAPPPQLASTNNGGIAGQDDSQPPTLIDESFRTPRYTSAARRAAYETVVLARILVDAQGRAKKVEFGSDVEFGMDERIITALKRARFRPGKNRFGLPRESWVQLKFNLEIQD